MILSYRYLYYIWTFKFYIQEFFSGIVIIIILVLEKTSDKEKRLQESHEINEVEIFHFKKKVHLLLEDSHKR